MGRRSEAVGLAEFFDYLRRIAMLSVYRFVHGLHLLGGDFTRQTGERASQLRPAIERLLAHQRNRLVRRKIMLVILQHRQMKSLDRTVGGIARNHIDLMSIQSPVEKS